MCERGEKSSEGSRSESALTAWSWREERERHRRGIREEREAIRYEETVCRWVRRVRVGLNAGARLRARRTAGVEQPGMLLESTSVGVRVGGLKCRSAIDFVGRESTGRHVG